MHFIWLPRWFIVSVSSIKSGNVEYEMYLENTAGKVCHMTICKCQHEFKLALVMSRWRWWDLWDLFLVQKSKKYFKWQPQKSLIQSDAFMNANQKRLFCLSSTKRKLFSYKPLKFFICLPFLLKWLDVVDIKAVYMSLFPFFPPYE